MFPGRKRLGGEKKKLTGREQKEGKEKEMETSTLSALSRQRWGHQERGAPDSRDGRGHFTDLP